MRKPSFSDYPTITRRLDAFQERAKSYGWTNSIDYEKGCMAILDFIDKGKGRIVDGYLVMFDVIEPWYSPDKVLQEWLVIKLYDGGSVDSIPPALSELAREFECKSIISADSSPIRIMEDAYKRAGFKVLTRSFTKEA